MLIYLDMCCLKRPFDDQSQPRIRIETEAVLSLLAMETDGINFIRSRALELENASNPIPERAARVAKWLSDGPLWKSSDLSNLESRIVQLMTAGVKNFDALHVASAEQAGATFFVTVDDRLLEMLQREPIRSSTRACSVFDCFQELSK